MSIGRDGIAGLVLLAISLVLLVKSFQLPSLAIVPGGPGFYPAIVLAFMAVASALLALFFGAALGFTASSAMAPAVPTARPPALAAPNAPSPRSVASR